MFEFGAVPVHMAASLDENENALAEYAQKLCEESGVEFVEIVRPKVYKYQLVEYGDERLYITGFKDARNARQISFSAQETSAISQLIAGDCASPEDSMALYARVQSALSLYAPKLSAMLKLDSMREGFAGSSQPDQGSAILQIVGLAAAKDREADLSGIGGRKGVERIRLTFAKEMNDPSNNFTFIDQSVTGMFESRQTLEL